MPLILFNENERFVAAWLRALFPEHDVDNGSITGLVGRDLVGFDRVHFFAGIGGWELALKMASWMRPRCGPAVAHVSRLVMPEAEGESEMNATCGHNFDALSPSATLQSSLESRLRAVLDVNGSPEYVLTWKHWAMPSGPPICALRARGRRTSDSGFTGWGTPTLRDWKDGAAIGSTPVNGLLGRMATLAGWPTPLSAPTMKRKGACKRPWDNFDVVTCRDGKARRIEPSVHPLAHGVPSRVGRLCGYGNAIVPQVAATFIRAFMESIS